MRRKFLRAPAALLLAGLAVAFAPASAGAATWRSHTIEPVDFAHSLHWQEAAAHERSLHVEDAVNEVDHTIAVHHSDGIDTPEHSDATPAAEMHAAQHSDAADAADAHFEQHAHAGAAHADEAGAHANELAGMNHRGEWAANHQHEA